MGRVTMFGRAIGAGLARAPRATAAPERTSALPPRAGAAVAKTETAIVNAQAESDRLMKRARLDGAHVRPAAFRGQVRSLR
jgi:hypothetical protein